MINYIARATAGLNLLALLQTVLISSCAATVQFLMHAMAARALGMVMYGEFQIILATATALSSLAPLGFQTSVTAILAAAADRRDWAIVFGALRMSTAWSLTSAGFAALAYCTFASVVGHLDAAAGSLIVGFATMLAFRKMRRRQLLGLGQLRLSLFLDDGLPPLLVVVAIGSGMAPKVVDLFGALSAATLIVMVMIAGSAIGAAWMSLLVSRAVGSFRPQHVVYRPREWISGSLFSLAAVIKPLILQADIMTLGNINDANGAALLGAAVRLSYVFTFFSIVFGATLSTRYARLSASEGAAERSILARLIRVHIFLSSILSAAMFVPLITFTHKFINMTFGSEFEDSAPAVLLLCAGEATQLATIPVAIRMLMGGCERAYGAALCGLLAIKIGAMVLGVVPITATSLAILDFGVLVAHSVFQLWWWLQRDRPVAKSGPADS